MGDSHAGQLQASQLVQRCHLYRFIHLSFPLWNLWSKTGR